MINKILLESAFVLHIRAYQETSVIVELFTRSFGRVNAVAKGAKRPKSPLRSILTPASKLSISLSGKNELKNLSSVEVSEHFNLTEGIAIHSLMYINELILKATEKEDPHQKVFDIYETLLKNLSQNRDRVVLEKLLRDFELSLLQEMGYGIDLSRDAQTNKIIDKKKFYIFNPDRGFLETEENFRNKSTFCGTDIINFSESNFEKKTTRDSAKIIMRKALDYHLGNKTLNTRKYLSTK